MAWVGKNLESRTRRKIAAFAAVIGLGLFAWFALRPAKVAETSNPLPSQNPAKLLELSIPPASFPPPVDHPVLASSAKFQTPGSTPEEDLEIVHSVLENFRRAFGGNPVGENEEIFAALRGKNPTGIRFLPDEFPGLQSDGTAQDRWGTPWRFHALSGQNMEVMSAGPDRIFGTDDDLGW